ncbi:MAG: lysylphosphatidylglycerol synthase domain-containing protein, partial [Streptosporangiaceae bacterium]
MVGRVIASRRVRAGVLVVVLACCAYGLYLDWPGTVSALSRLRWYSVAEALIAAIAGNWCLMFAWRAVLADFGSPLRPGVAARICFLGQLGKYVPGAVWAVAAQMELGHDQGVPRRRGVASILVSLAITTGTGLAIAAATLPFSSPEVLRRYWWVLLAVPVFVALLCPPVLGPVVDRALKIIRQPPLEQRLTWRGLLRASGWNVAGWLLLGTQVWVLLAGMTGRGLGVAVVAIGGYALAYSAGLLLVVFPSGLGAREVILIAAVTPVAPHSVALGLALAARLVATISDLTCGALGFALGRAGTAGRHAAGAPVTRG